jgi:hypothetical protein
MASRMVTIISKSTGATVGVCGDVHSDCIDGLHRLLALRRGDDRNYKDEEDISWITR